MDMKSTGLVLVPKQGGPVAACGPEFSFMERIRCPLRVLALWRNGGPHPASTQWYVGQGRLTVVLPNVPPSSAETQGAASQETGHLGS